MRECGEIKIEHSAIKGMNEVVRDGDRRTESRRLTEDNDGDVN
jgi:hypothetical protein